MSINLLEHVIEIPKEMLRKVTLRSKSTSEVLMLNSGAKAFPVLVIFDAATAPYCVFYKASGRCIGRQTNQMDIIAIEPITNTGE